MLQLDVRAHCALSAVSMELADDGSGESGALWIVLLVAGVVDVLPGPNSAAPSPIQILKVHSKMLIQLQ